MHWNAHVPPPHVGCACATAGQVWPHPPQLFGSVDCVTHAPLQGGAIPGHMLTHEKLVADAEHWGVVAGHTAPHAPQFAGFVMSVSHPSSGLPAQCDQPGAHDERGTEHLPALHVTAPLT